MADTPPRVRLTQGDVTAELVVVADEDTGRTVAFPITPVTVPAGEVFQIETTRVITWD